MAIYLISFLLPKKMNPITAANTTIITYGISFNTRPVGATLSNVFVKSTSFLPAFLFILRAAVVLPSDKSLSVVSAREASASANAFAVTTYESTSCFASSTVYETLSAGIPLMITYSPCFNFELKTIFLLASKAIGAASPVPLRKLDKIIP